MFHELDEELKIRSIELFAQYMEVYVNKSPWARTECDCRMLAEEETDHKMLLLHNLIANHYPLGQCEICGFVADQIVIIHHKIARCDDSIGISAYRAWAK